MLEWVKNRRRRKALLVALASEHLVGYPSPWEWPHSVEQEVSVGEVVFRDRHLPQDSEPPIHILYGRIGQRIVQIRQRREPSVLLAFHEEDNDPATFQRLKEIITSTTPTQPDLGDPL